LGTYNEEVHQRFYDFVIENGRVRITIPNLNFTSVPNDPIDIDEVEGSDLSIQGVRPALGVGLSSSIAQFATVSLIYPAGTFASENLSEVYACSNWNYATRLCSSTFSQVSSDLDILSNHRSFNVTALSAYVIAETSSCGNGICAGWETPQNCPADCNETISTPASKTITVTSPNGGETISGTHTITWTSQNLPDPCPIKITYCKSPEGCTHTIATDEANDGSYSWDTTTISDDNDFSIQLYTECVPGTSTHDLSDNWFTIDNSADSGTSPSTGDLSTGATSLVIRDDDGEVLDTSDGEEPLDYLHGADNIVPGLEKEMLGKSAGDKFTVVVEPADGYGDRDEEALVEAPRTAFPDDEDGIGIEIHSRSSWNVVRYQRHANLVGDCGVVGKESLLCGAIVVRGDRQADGRSQFLCMCRQFNGFSRAVAPCARDEERDLLVFSCSFGKMRHCETDDVLVLLVRHCR